MSKVTVGNYYGGKIRHLGFILPMLPKAKIYVEPFGGSAAVLLNRERSEREVYSDLYKPVVALMRALRDSSEELIHALDMTPYSRSEFYTTYPAMTGSNVEVARQIVIRMLQGVGGFAATQTNRSGWGRHFDQGSRARSNSYIHSNFRKAAKRLQGVTIKNQNALDLIRKYDSPDTLFYLDPPYVLSVRNMQKGYTHELEDELQVKLSKLLNSIRGKAVVSGYTSPLYNDLYSEEKGWHVFYDRAKILSPNPVTDTITRVEVLWTNYEPNV